MGLRDFFDAQAVAPLKAAARLPFGGGELPLRPLTLEEFLKLDAIAGSHRNEIPAILRSAAIEDAEWFAAAVQASWEVLWPEHLQELIERMESDSFGVLEMVLGLLRWYHNEHDWEAIQERLGDREAVSSADDEHAVEAWLLLAEENGGRTIEQVLGMRLEAALSRIEHSIANLVSAGKAPAKLHRGRIVSMFESMTSLPSEADFWSARYKADEVH